MFHLLKRAANTVAAAAAGKVRLFVDTDGLPKTRDEGGALTILGNGITNIALVNTAGRVKTYRITRQDGGTFDFQVTDGQNGIDGQGQPATNTPSKIDPDDAASTGTVTARYALEDHQHQIVTDVPVALGATAAEGSSTSFSRADHVHVNPVIAHETAVDPHPQYLTLTEADALFTTPAEASAAAPVQSVAGKTGVVTLAAGDVGLGNVRNPVAPNVHTTTPQTLNQTLTAVATMIIPANTLQAGDAFEFDVLFGTLVNTTAASNLEVAVFVNGAQNAIATAAMGTTAVAAPGRGGAELVQAGVP